VEVLGARQLQASFSSASETWRIETGGVISNNWQYVEVSWHPEKDAYVYIGKQRRPLIVQSHANISDSTLGLQNQTSTVYIGSFDQQTYTASPMQDFQVLIDELGVWFADRDHVKAFGFLEDGK